MLNSLHSLISSQPRPLATGRQGEVATATTTRPLEQNPGHHPGASEPTGLDPALIERLQRMEAVAHAPALTALHVPTLREHVALLGELIDALEKLPEPPKATLQKPAPHDPTRTSATNVRASLVMYWLTFAIGKIAANTANAAATVCGRPDLAPYMAVINTIGVPIIQVALAEPIAGAVRTAGPTHPSPDGRAYANHQTAFACWLGAKIEGDEEAAKRYVKVIADTVDDLIRREQALMEPDDPLATASTLEGRPHRIPQAWSSQVSAVPKRDKDGNVMPGEDDPAVKVICAARSRAFRTDEAPVHTFSLLNAISAMLSLLWSRLLGPIWSRVPDALLHTALGSIAMAWMYDLQDKGRAFIQGARIQNPSDKANLALQRDAAAQRLDHFKQQFTQAKAALNQLEHHQARLAVLRNTCAKPAHETIDQALQECRQAALTIQPVVKAIERSKAKAEREAVRLSSRTHREQSLMKRTFRAYAGEKGLQADAWLDGRALVIRNVSKALGYMTALGPSTVQTIMLAQYFLAKAQANTGPPSMNGTFVPSPAAHGPTGLSDTDQALQLAKELAWAGTIPLVAIIGWTGKNLYCTPAWEIAFHTTVSGCVRVASSTKATLDMLVSGSAAPENPRPAVTAPEHPDPDLDHVASMPAQIASVNGRLDAASDGPQDDSGYETADDGSNDAHASFDDWDGSRGLDFNDPEATRRKARHTVSSEDETSVRISSQTSTSGEASNPS